MEKMRTLMGDLPEIELLDGRSHPKVSPKTPRSIVQLSLARLIEDCAGGMGVAARFEEGASSLVVRLYEAHHVAFRVR